MNKYVKGIIIVLIIIMGLALWFPIIRFTMLTYQNIRREVFLETRSYNEGKMQELVKYRHEYLISNNEVERQAIISILRHSFAEYDKSKLPEDLRKFLEEVL